MLNIPELVSIFVISAVVFNSLRDRHYLRREAVLKPYQSPWNRIYKKADDNSFLHLTGFSRSAFKKLLRILFDEEDEHEQRGRGRPRNLDNTALLGLYLCYVGSTMTTKWLCLQFGIVESTANEAIIKMRTLICDRLHTRPEARVIWPNIEEMEKWAALVRVREPTVRTVIGFVDGVALHVQCGDSDEEQSTAYNGHCKDTMCNNVLAFSPLGKVFHASINYPGSWHDSQVVQMLAAIVLRKIGIYQICVDKGFPRSGELYDKFVGPLSDRTKGMLSPINRDILIERHNIYVSLRQASEWGMRALQGTFCRLKTRLPSDKATRRDLIYSIVLLHNFRTDEVGLNQIATVFNPEYQQCINLYGYDRIARYF